VNIKHQYHQDLPELLDGAGAILLDDFLPGIYW
jgi:hypothetical protein